MCGRFVSTTGPADLAAHFGAELIVGDLPQRWNVAPTSRVWVVRDAGTTRVVESMRWGLVPSWADNPSIGNRMFNARSETLTQRPAYRAAARRRRCIVPADGFYEWAPSIGGARKQAWYFRRTDGAPLAMAGLWETWIPGDGASSQDGANQDGPNRDGSNRDGPSRDGPGGNDVMHTCTVVTTTADAVVAAVHDRMPLVLESGSIDAWLDPDLIDPHEVSALLSGNRSPLVTSHAVGPEVNNARNDGPGLISAVDPPVDDPGGERRLL